MQLKSIQWGEHTWEELSEIAASGAVVVAPFGAVEQHGPMLPVDTDVRIAEKWATDGARVALERFGIPTLVLPTMPFGLSAHHMRFCGTITLEPELYVSLVAQILGCVVAHGFRRIALVRGHGGNRAGMELGARKLVTQLPEPVLIALFEDHRDPEFAKTAAQIAGEEPPEGIAFHASRWETSEALSDRPHLVRKDRMVKPAMKVEQRPEWQFMTHWLTETGASGDPSLARADLGDKQWRGMAEAVGLFIKRLWETKLPED